MTLQPTPPQGSIRPRRRLWQSLVLPLLLLGLLLPGGCDRLGSSRGSGERRPAPVATQAPSGRLQEAPPPAAVQQINAELADRHPRVTVTRPSPDTVLPPGPLTLELTLTDWPLVQTPELGLGPHLVVQIDADEPLRISDWNDGDPTTGRLSLKLPPLTPGSHRLTLYAARPWGEAVKQPGASTQLVVHRVAADPLSLPPPRSPQLIPVSPAGLAQAEPVLIDWLLLDAPLQGLRQDDGQWRLRISVNGDSFLVDQTVPLWLSGFHNGSNAVLLELLDGRGEPLNPPFSSAVREVVLDRSVPRPAWLRPLLGDRERAVLLGRQPEREPGSAAEAGAEAGADAAGAAVAPAEAAVPLEPVEAAEPVEPEPGRLPVAPAPAAPVEPVTPSAPPSGAPSAGGEVAAVERNASGDPASVEDSSDGAIPPPAEALAGSRRQLEP